MLRLSSTKPKFSVDDIFAEDDEFELLNVAPLRVKAPPTNLLASSFEEINAFYEKHGRKPDEDAEAIDEMRLARRLRNFINNESQRNELAQFDHFGLLVQPVVYTTRSPQPLAVNEPEPKDDANGYTANSLDDIFKDDDALLNPPTKSIDKAELVTSLDDIFDDDDALLNPPTKSIDKAELVTSLDDIFDDDDDLLDFDAPDIFNIEHVPVEKKEQPDEIAKRQPCAEFPRYAPLFAKVHHGLKQGEIDKARFRHELGLKLGDFFILSGIMGYIHDTGPKLEGYKTYNARLHIVFDNGTESWMLYQSLTHGLVRDEEGSKVLMKERLVPSDMPIPTGTVYIVSTLSEHPELIPYKSNLYKVGFTENTVEERTKNAAKDKTFLEAPVRIVMTTQCYNIDAQKLEALVHGFLAAQRLNVHLKGHDGQIYSPREWFHAPLITIQKVIEHILDGTISQYRMDNTSGKVVKK